MIELSPSEAALVMAFADDEHIIGHRHTEWIGRAPFLEEDLAFASIGQDELGHAIALYGLLGDDVEAIAFARPAASWRCCALVEEPCRDWAEALVRHWLYDAAEHHRWDGLRRCVDGADVAGIATAALRDEEYHRRHAAGLLLPLLADRDTRPRLQAAAERLLPLAVEMLDPPPDVTDESVLVVLRDSHAAWWAEIGPVIEPLLGGVDVERWRAADHVGRTMRTEHFGAVLDDMTAVQRLDPTATW